MPLVLLRAFRCSHCQSRFYRFSLGDGFRQRGRRKRQEESTVILSVESSQESPDFKQFIRDIHEAEKQRGLRGS